MTEKSRALIGLICNLRNRVVGCCGQPNKLHAKESLGGRIEEEKVTRSGESTGKEKNARKGKRIELYGENHWTNTDLKSSMSCRLSQTLLCC